MISYFGLPRHDENNFYDGCYLDVISGNVLNQLCTYRKDRKGITYTLEDPGVRFNQAVCNLQWVITRCVSKCITTRATQHISVEWTKKECSDFKFVHWNSLHPCLQSSWDSLYACLLQGFHGYDPMCQHSSDCRNHSNGSFWNVSQEYEQSVYRSEVFLILLLRCVVLFDFFILPFQNIGFLAVWNQSAFNHCRTCCTTNHIINAAFCFTVACSITSAIVC